MIAKIDFVGALKRYRFRRVVIYLCECGHKVAQYHQRRGEEYILSDCYCGRAVDVQLIRNDYRECFRVGKGCRTPIVQLTTPLHGKSMEFKTGEELLQGGSSNDTS